MKQPIRIGFLQPYSSIYPYFAEHLLTGFFLGFGRDPFRQNDIQFIPHFVESGSSAKIAAGARKLIQFDQVDMLSGLINYAALPELTPILEQKQKLGFFFDLGDSIPKFDYLSPNVFFSSNQLWQSQFALGQWAPKHFGTPGVILMPIYDAGYDLHTSFQQGLSWSGGGEVLLSVVNAKEKNPNKMRVRPYLKEIKKTAPAFVHALFSGPNGIEFLKEWVDCGLNKEIPLVVSEPMTYPEWLADVQNLDLELYTASLYDPEDVSKQNRKFKQKFTKVAKQPVNTFALLGYEAGLLFKEVFSHLRKRDFDTVKKRFQSETIKGPRSERNFYPDSGFSLPPINIIKINTSRTGIRKMVIDQGHPLKYDETIFEDIRKAMPTGWQNPYLCY